MTGRKILPFAAAAALWAAVPAVAAEHTLGVGLHYWTTVDDLEDQGFELDENGTSALLTYQADPAGWLKFQVDLEYFADGFAGAASEALSPQVFVLVGGTLYGGVGVGVTYASDLEDEVSDPFWAARVGLDLTLLPRTHLDLNANYQADTFEALDEASTDTVTLGAALRFRIR